MNIHDPLNIPGLRRAVGTLGAYPRGIGPVNRTMGFGPSVDDLMGRLRSAYNSIIPARGIGHPGNHGPWTLVEIGRAHV